MIDEFQILIKLPMPVAFFKYETIMLVIFLFLNVDIVILSCV